MMTMTQWALTNSSMCVDVMPGHRKPPLYGRLTCRPVLTCLQRDDAALGGLGREPRGPQHPPQSPPDKPGRPHGGGQGCRRVSSGAHTLSARGDNQRGATGQPTRWSALHLVHSAGSHSIGPCLRALAGNTMQGRSWRWRRWW